MARRITWLGHSTVLIDWDGARLLTDPVLRLRIAHLRRHAEIPEFEAPDGVLLSHAHRDHADLPSLRRLPRGVPVFGPRKALGVATAAGMGAISPMAAGDVRRLPGGGPTIEAIHASHDGRRLPYGDGADALGFLVGGDGGIWYPGDTEADTSFHRLVYRKLEVALMPVWGWGPSLGPGHMNPRQAAELTAQITPKYVIPIHWGTYLPTGLKRRHGHLLVDPPGEFARHVADLAPEVQVRQLRVGETLSLD